MKRRFKVPLWVELVYNLLGWVDNKIVSGIGGKLMWWQTGLLERYCQCEQCEERKRTGAA